MNKTLNLQCCVVDSDGNVQEKDIINIHWETPAAETETDSTTERQLLEHKLDSAFDDVSAPFKAAIRGNLLLHFSTGKFNFYKSKSGHLCTDTGGNLIALKASNIDWEDMNGIVRDLTCGQTAKIFIQPDEPLPSEQQVNVNCDIFTCKLGHLK